MKKNLRPAFYCLVMLLLGSAHTFSQNTYFGDDQFNWPGSRPPQLPANIDAYTTSNLVILEEKSSFYFYASDHEKIVRDVVLKINNDKGLEALQAYVLPESFDQGYDHYIRWQGGANRARIPYIMDFGLKKLAARKFRSNRWSPVALDNKYETIRWFDMTGEYKPDDIYVFKLKGLAVGDVVQLHYEMEFISDYGDNLFYFNSAYPKLNCEYDFIYKINKYQDYSYVLPLYIADSLITRSVAPASDKPENIIRTEKIKLHNLKGINYPANSFEGRNMPHVYVDFRFYRMATGYYSTPEGRSYTYQTYRAKNFEWVLYRDTVNNYTKIYDKQSAAIRKFVATLPPIGSDSSHKTFFKALCDTFNSFRFITPVQLFYNESALYNLSSGDHLLKRRMVGSMAWKLCTDILNESNIFYYVANVQDRRFGEHSIYYRAHYGYERQLIALPSGSSYIYFLPPTTGVKYHLNELPFYYEGSLASLRPYNFQQNDTARSSKFFKFIKTHKGTYNENTRTENATVKILLDSARADLTTKESLSGQYSTVLRHLYLKEAIDSTIAPYYFKKCTDKPGAGNVKIKLSSNISDYPFRYTFNCSESVKLQNPQQLNLKNWFSFVLSKDMLPEKPTHDYYIDFDLSDSYNFLLDFSKPVELKNGAAFSKNINNDLFELESAIVKNSESNYLLKVRLVIKERKVPEDKANLLMELVSALDELNGFVLEFNKV